uniref:Calcineurin-like phosphoesterase domain-containing protein n=1 Tax=Romanomermis culicivorax TaxID=13658 RepID=A0A915KHL1_ROMCU
MAADTQFPWTEPHQKNLESERRISKNLIKNYFYSMSKLASKIHVDLKAIFINGDLTAFGHDHELSTFRELLQIPKSWTQVHLGLGNHDYANNVDDCFENQCSTRMVKYMMEQKALYSNMDVEVTHFPPANEEDWYTVVYRGSLAYSLDIGGIHIVQLHNYPTYANQWNSTNYLEDILEVFQINDSLEWLKRDLDDASNKNRSIIICMHDPILPRRFQNLIIKYKISAIFVGHYHSNIGLYDRNTESDDIVPVFGSGSAIYGTYLLVKFENQNRMQISAWNAKNGDVQKIALQNLEEDFQLG